MKKLHVAQSPLTNTIYAGSISKDGKNWLSNQTDVTTEALVAVAEHVHSRGGVEIGKDGKPHWAIAVRKLDI